MNYCISHERDQERASSRASFDNCTHLSPPPRDPHVGGPSGDHDAWAADAESDHGPREKSPESSRPVDQNF